MSEKRTLEKNKFCNACIKKEKWFSHGYKSSEFISGNIIRILKSYYHFKHFAEYSYEHILDKSYLLKLLIYF